MVIKNVVWTSQVWMILKEPMLDRKPLNVRKIGKPSVLTQNLLNIRGFISVKTPACKECGKAYSCNPDLIGYQGICTVKSLMNVRNVGTFIGGLYLNEHQRTILVKSPTECRKDFGQRAHLTNHQRIHIGKG